MYDEAIVTFLDILGFRKKIETLNSSEINKILDIVERVATPDKTERFLYNPETIVFSDSIVRTRKLRTKENLNYQIGLFFHELLDIVHAQAELIDHGILIRGGVAFGNICTNDNRIFGPALVRAYDLESVYANYPRLVVDPELIKEHKKNKLLRHDSHSVKQDSAYINKLVKKSDDGLYFIDYGRAIESELDDPAMYPSFLSRHRELIVDGSSEFEHLNKNLEKYLWLANYHNGIIEEMTEEYLEQYSLKRKDFLITSSDIPTLQQIKS